MLGKILDFSQDSMSGAITGNDSNRYSFTLEDFKSSDFKPERGIEVPPLIWTKI